jgi:hypothetical protein
MVRGTHIEFATIPVQSSCQRKTSFTSTEVSVIETEISNLLQKSVIVKTHHEPGEYVSPIFVRPKKDGTTRMILNLKSLNQSVVYLHFKMDTLKDAIRLMKPNCYMASIDLKDAYYSVPINKSHQKYLKFMWNNVLYAFTCFPNGLAFCPRKFTKLLKPVYSTLRQLGHVSSPYIDDSFLEGDDYQSCLENLVDTIKLLHSLGLIIHPKKSVLIPTQRLIFLGFILDSILMRIYLTPDKCQKLVKLCYDLLHHKSPTIRMLSQVIGYIITTFPGVMFGPLFFRHLERDKTCSLQQNHANFDAVVSLSHSSQQELSWWIENASDSYNAVSHGEPDITLTTDASLTGWGCVIGDDSRTRGLWTQEESLNHINYLELLAVYLSLKSFVNFVTGKHVKVLIDNITALSDINHMGTSKSVARNELVKTIWLWCKEHSVWLTAVHIPGCDNVDADEQSRNSSTTTEWTLDSTIFNRAISKLNVNPNIDLFASRLNFRIKPFVSYKPDPEALAIDAFHMSWKPYLAYCFPPFCLITRILQKVVEEKVTIAAVLPKWPTQIWWSRMTRLLIRHPVLLPNTTTTIYLPHSPTTTHPMYPRLQLLFCLLSGDHSKTNEFQQKLPTLLSVLGDKELLSNINLTSKGGQHTVVNGKLILFEQL